MRANLALHKGLTDTEIKMAIYNHYGGDTDHNIFDIQMENITVLSKKTYTDEFDLVEYEIKRYEPTKEEIADAALEDFHNSDYPMS